MPQSQQEMLPFCKRSVKKSNDNQLISLNGSNNFAKHNNAGMHTGSASNGLPNRGANDSIKRLLTSISETASKIFNKKQLHDEFML